MSNGEEGTCDSAEKPKKVPETVENLDFRITSKIQYEVFNSFKMQCYQVLYQNECKVSISRSRTSQREKNQAKNGSSMHLSDHILCIVFISLLFRYRLRHRPGALNRKSSFKRDTCLIGLT